LASNWLMQGLWKKLNCLVPVYGKGDDAGNYTEVWLSDGRKFLDRRRIRTVLKNLTAYLGATAHQQDTAWSVKKGKSRGPLVLGPEMVLIPLRLRHPRGRDEGGTGYAVQQNIVKWEPCSVEPYKTCLYLKGGQTLYCLLSLATLEKHLLAGQKALKLRRDAYRELASAGCFVCENASHLLVEPNGSATPVQVLDSHGKYIVLRLENLHTGG